MNKKELRELENAVRQMAFSAYEATPERVQEIKQRAFEQYQAYIAKAQEKKRKEKRMLSQLVAVVAIAILLFLSPLVYNMIAPMPNGYAISFFRQISIWLNDHLHTTIEIPTDERDEIDVSFDGEYTFDTIQEAAKMTHYPVIHFPETDSVKLLGIDFYQEDSVFELNLHYETMKGKMSILIKPIYDRNTIAFKEEATIVKTDIGNVYVWVNPPYTKAYLSYNTFEASIISNDTLEAFSNYIVSIDVFTE